MFGGLRNHTATCVNLSLMNLIQIKSALVTAAAAQTKVKSYRQPQHELPAALGDAGFFQFFRVVSSDYGKPS